MARVTVGTGLGLALVLAGPVAAHEIGPEALTSLPPADVVILGEVHDHPVHHRNQAAAVAAIAPAALVFEMLRPDQAARVTPGTRGDAGALGAALEWDASGWPDFAMYHPIFTAAPSAEVHGGALPREEVRRAMQDGAAAVFDAAYDAAFGAAARFGLADPLTPEDQAAREAAQMTAHCDALPESMLTGLVEAQRLRDAALARAVVAATAATGGPVVVITGTGHARRDEGIPAALALAAPELSVLSIGQLEADPGPAAPYDLWIVTEPQPRPDPCAALRQQG
ncbi:MAG: ChaN family lipoprotein [Gemmobacter sp.]